MKLENFLRGIFSRSSYHLWKYVVYIPCIFFSLMTIIINTREEDRIFLNVMIYGSNFSWSISFIFIWIPYIITLFMLWLFCNYFQSISIRLSLNNIFHEMQCITLSTAMIIQYKLRKRNIIQKGIAMINKTSYIFIHEKINTINRQCKTIYILGYPPVNIDGNLQHLSLKRQQQEYLAQIPMQNL